MGMIYCIRNIYIISLVGLVYSQRIFDSFYCCAIWYTSLYFIRDVLLEVVKS